MLKKTFVILAALAALAPAAAQAAAPKKHSLSEYAYLVGTWNCVAHPADRPGPVKYSTTFAWKYPNHSVIDQSLVFAKAQFNFMLTYDAASDSFRGTYVDSNGTIGVWTNPGPSDGAWTEIGYSYRGGGTLAPESRTNFFGVTPTHYAFKYWAIKSLADAGTLADTEDCVKSS